MTNEIGQKATGVRVSSGDQEPALDVRGFAFKFFGEGGAHFESLETNRFEQTPEQQKRTADLLRMSGIGRKPFDLDWGHLPNPGPVELSANARFFVENLRIAEAPTVVSNAMRELLYGLSAQAREPNFAVPDAATDVKKNGDVITGHGKPGATVHVMWTLPMKSDVDADALLRSRGVERTKVNGDGSFEVKVPPGASATVRILGADGLYSKPVDVAV